MIVINNGVPKSATTLVWEYQQDLIRASYPQNGLKEFKNRNGGWLWVPSVTDDMFKLMIEVEKEFGSFVIKTHRPPQKNTKRLVEEYGAKVTCCYRDPRDNILSALDHGARTRAGGDSTGAFEDMVTIEDGITEVKNWIGIYKGWRDYGRALMIKYEDLMADQRNLLSQMVGFLNLNLGKQILDQIYDKHEKTKKTAHNFNKGTCCRWKTEMSPDQIARCNKMLLNEITMMGYSLT